MTIFVLSINNYIMGNDFSAKMAEDKIDHIEQESTIHTNVSAGTDKAAAVIQESGRTVALTHENNKKVLRKIDTHILPVILAIYFLQALDKVIKIVNWPDIADPSRQHWHMPPYSDW